MDTKMKNRIKQVQKVEKKERNPLSAKARIILSLVGILVVVLGLAGFWAWKNREKIEFALRYDADYKNASGVSFADQTHQLATKDRVVGDTAYTDNGSYEYTGGLPRTFSALVRLDKEARGGVIYGNNIGDMGSYLEGLDFVNFQITVDGYPQLFLRLGRSSTFPMVLFQRYMEFLA